MRKTMRMVVGVLGAGALGLGLPTPVTAGPDEPNNAQKCREIASGPGAIQSPPAFGGCVSTLASVGNLLDPDFPSNALAVANCKDLEKADFLAAGEPNPGGPYPYQFYWFLGSDAEAFTARNRAECRKILEAIHTGVLAPPFPS